MDEWRDGPVRVLIGDVRARLSELPDASVHCVVTSPPYWGLRDYGTATWEGGEPACEHVEREIRTGLGLADWSAEHARGGAHKAGRVHSIQYRGVCGRCGAAQIDAQLGLEATPEEYVAAMVEVFRGVRRVLRADGTCWLNLGDSYAAQGGGKMPGLYQDKRTADATWEAPRTPPIGLKPKDMVGIPWRVALALQADGWWLRSDIIWSKPNPMPESVSDRPTNAHEHVFMLSKAGRYFYDAEAVREPHAEEARPQSEKRRLMRMGRGIVSVAGNGQTSKGVDGGLSPTHVMQTNPAGRNLRSVWTIATQPYPEAHFATFPDELARRCIAAGTSERGCCPECGAPWRRVVQRQRLLDGEHPVTGAFAGPDEPRRMPNGIGHWRFSTRTTALGWEPNCCHQPEPVPCTVLDPFAGSGTTLAVARRMGRQAIGIELQSDYLPLIRARVASGALPLLELAVTAGPAGEQADLFAGRT